MARWARAADGIKLDIMVTPAFPAPHFRGSSIVASRKGLAPSKIVVPSNKGVKISDFVTIRKPAHPLYAFWRDPENLAKVIKHPVTITTRSPIEAHWSVSASPGDRPVEWDALIINDEPDQLIAWRSSDASEIAHAGTVRFVPAPGDEGTEVTVTLEYVPPGGRPGAMMAKISAEEAGQQIGGALRRFKALMEAGEIPTTEGQPVGQPQRKHKT
jgi:uncharacterized membrane protein